MRLIATKRVYDPWSEDDGFRVLVDRLWPRGIAKEKAKIDLWYKDVAPSTVLRQWFHHGPAEWEEFRRRYEEELKNNPEALEKFSESLEGQEKITLIYGAKDREHNQAQILKSYMEKCLGEN